MNGEKYSTMGKSLSVVLPAISNLPIRNLSSVSVYPGMNYSAFPIPSNHVMHDAWGKVYHTIRTRQ